ncbi:hypothetical protein BGX34_012118 [Mortierella sp. NVP85]|nr:hypothetical protein BGX34_012118 [Mortierella sp. NVP85]
MLFLYVSQSRKYAWKHRAKFCEFGSVAVFLEMTPVLNLLFFWTNVVGAALWVADEIEEAQRRDRLANRTASGQDQGSHYVTFHPYESSAPGLPTEPLLGGHHGYGSQPHSHAPQYVPPSYVQQQQQQQQQLQAKSSRR